MLSLIPVSKQISRPANAYCVTLRHVLWGTERPEQGRCPGATWVEIKHWSHLEF